MNSVRGTWCAVVVGVVSSVAATGRAAAQDDEIGIAIGARPVPVTIEDLAGHPVDLGRIVGQKPVLLEFWATWCPLCAELFPRISAAHARYGNRVEFVVVAVAVNQSQASITRHLKKHPMPFRVLWDTNGKATRAFQAPSTSYVVVLDAHGKVVYTGVGADQDVEAAIRRAVGDGRGR